MGLRYPLPFHGVASVTVWLQGFKHPAGLQLLRTLLHANTSNMRPIPGSVFSLISATHEFFSLRSPQKIAAQSHENVATPPLPPAPAPSSLPAGGRKLGKKVGKLNEEATGVNSWLTLTPCGQLADEDEARGGMSPCHGLPWGLRHARCRLCCSGLCSSAGLGAVICHQNEGWVMRSSVCTQHQPHVKAGTSWTCTLTLKISIQSPVWVSSLSLVILRADGAVLSWLVTWNVKKDECIWEPLQANCYDSVELRLTEEHVSAGQHLNMSMPLKWKLLQMHLALCGVNGQLVLVLWRTGQSA